MYILIVRVLTLHRYVHHSIITAAQKHKQSKNVTLNIGAYRITT